MLARRFHSHRASLRPSTDKGWVLALTLQCSIAAFGLQLGSKLIQAVAHRIGLHMNGMHSFACSDIHCHLMTHSASFIDTLIDRFQLCTARNCTYWFFFAPNLSLQS